MPFSFVSHSDYARPAQPANHATEELQQNHLRQKPESEDPKHTACFLRVLHPQGHDAENPRSDRLSVFADLSPPLEDQYEYEAACRPCREGRGTISPNGGVVLGKGEKRRVLGSHALIAAPTRLAACSASRRRFCLLLGGYVVKQAGTLNHRRGLPLDGDAPRPAGPSTASPATPSDLRLNPAYPRSLELPARWVGAYRYCTVAQAGRQQADQLLQRRHSSPSPRSPRVPPTVVPLYDGEGGACVPPAAPTADASTYDSCFCNDQRLAPFKSGTSGVCDKACVQNNDLASIQGWFTSFCNNIPAADNQQPTTTSTSSTGRPASRSKQSGRWRRRRQHLVRLSPAIFSFN